MWFSRKTVVKSEPAIVPAAARQPSKAAGQISTNVAADVSTKGKGDAAEAAALRYLVKAGLKLVEANYRTPGRGGGEIDLVMRAPDGTLVFVEVRQRASQSHGGAGASISSIKQQRIVFAARHFLMRFKSLPPCRFDVVLVQGRAEEAGGITLEWLKAAFDAS